MARNIQLLLIDQDPESRISLKKLLSNQGCAIIGEAHFGVEAISLALQLKPEVVLLHLEEPLARGLQTIEAIGEVSPNSPVVVLSQLGSTPYVQKAMVAGAKAYLVQPVGDRAIHNALRQAVEAAQQRRVPEPGDDLVLPKAATTITVFGTKGGIGKTTLSTNLALSIRKLTEARVLVVDLDVVFGDAALMLDLVPETTIGDWLHERAMGENGFGEYADFGRFVTEHPAGLSVLAARPQPGMEFVAPPDAIASLLRTAAQHYDYVVIDTPGSLNGAVRVALSESTIVLLVSSTDMASVKDTRLCLDILRSWGFTDDRVKLAVNHANTANGVRVSDIEQVLNDRVFWSIPFDKEAVLCSQIGQPLVMARPKSRAARNIIELSSALTGARLPKSSWLNKLLGR